MKNKENMTELERIDKLYALFDEYRSAYLSEWERLEKCERLYRAEHWEDVPQGEANEPRPTTPMIYSTVENIRADLMDMMPEAVITADEPKYERLAELLGGVIKENCARTGFEHEYARLTHDLLVGGTMVQEIGFDPTANGGLGGAYIRHVDTRGIMFDPYCTDIQDSRAVFKFTPYRREWFRAHYPDAADAMAPDALTFRRAADSGLATDDSECIMLIECWEREFDKAKNRYRVHMCRLAGRQLLEDSRRIKPQGYYAHGKYPFTVTALHERKGTFLGFGIADMFESQQRFSDKLDQIIMKNALMASRNKLRITGASGFDANDLRDWSKDVHKGDSLNGVSWFSTPPLPGYMLEYAAAMRQSIKEESGANDFSRGNTASGVTAASAIAALQEMSNKRARMAMKAVHASFAEAVRQELEIEREFSRMPRMVRTSEQARSLFCADMMFERSALGDAIPIELQVSVKVQRENRFSVVSHNELVMSLVQAGMITPDVGLELLIFDGKEQAKALMSSRAAANTANGANTTGGISAS